MQKIILPITPQTWVRVTANDRWFFKIPRDKLRPSGRLRLERIERYNNYKISVLALAKEQNFKLPDVGAGIIFYMPVPPSWSGKKKKLHHGAFHQSRPDLKNLLSAFEDSLMAEDKALCFYTRLGKRWVNEPEGWIEITITDPSRIFLEPPSKEGENRLR